MNDFGQLLLYRCALLRTAMPRAQTSRSLYVDLPVTRINLPKLHLPNSVSRTCRIQSAQSVSEFGAMVQATVNPGETIASMYDWDRVVKTE